MRFFFRALTGLLLTTALAAAVGTIKLDSYTKVPYTEDQATAGAKTYKSSCAKCHGTELNNGVASKLIGTAFLKKWSKFTLNDFHFIITSSMPYTKPGSLKPEEYINVTAYILQQNGVKAGKTKLKAENLAKYNFNR